MFGVKKLRSIWLFIALLSVWYVVWGLSLFPIQLLPAPHTVGWTIIEQVQSAIFWQDLSISLYRVFVGFLFAAVLGFIVGILIAFYPVVNDIFTPFNNFIRYLPVAALIPLLILFFGTGDFEKFLVIFIGTFFQITLLIRDDIANLDKGYIETARMLGLKNDSDVIGRVIIPARMTFFLDIFKVGLGWAWSYLLLAEVVAAQSGIGFKLMQAQRFLQSSKIIAFIIVVGIIGLMFDFVFDSINTRIYKWRFIKTSK